MATNISYQLVTADRFDDVVEHLEKFFQNDEPMSKSLDFDINDEGSEDDEGLALKFADHVKEMLRKNYSLMAVDENNVLVGVLVNDAIRPGYMDAFVNDIEDEDNGAFKRITKILYALNTAVDLFAQYQVDEVFENHFLSVDGHYRHRGIGRELLQRSEVVARNAGFKLMKGDLTGLYSQRIFEAANFDVLHEIYYREFLDDHGKPLLNVQPPHEKVQLVVRRLQ